MEDDQDILNSVRSALDAAGLSDQLTLFYQTLNARTCRHILESGTTPKNMRRLASIYKNYGYETVLAENYLVCMPTLAAKNIEFNDLLSTHIDLWGRGNLHFWELALVLSFKLQTHDAHSELMNTPMRRH
jgi:hypothetical protein